MQVLGTIIGIFLVDRIGRRKILIQSSVQTFIAELALGIVFAYSVTTDTAVLAATPSVASITLVSSLAHMRLTAISCVLSGFLQISNSEDASCEAMKLGQTLVDAHALPSSVLSGSYSIT